MRIIGGKDYYDGVAIDTDKSRIFLRSNFRTSTFVDHDESLDYSKVDFLSFDRRHDGNLTIIDVLFCGVHYKGICTNSVHRKYSPYATFSSIIWTYDEFKSSPIFKDYPLRKKSSKWKFRIPFLETDDDLIQFFTPTPVSKICLDYLIDNDISIAVGLTPRLEKPVWYMNTDVLKYLSFFRVVPSTDAYQKLDMWIGSQLAKDENRMVKLSDDQILKKHGFDKHTFRKEKVSV